MTNNEEKSGGSSSSGKKGKSKSSSNGNNNSDKPKQPQRGLGVAQLEKLRLHGQMASYGFYPQPHYPGLPPTPFPHPPFQEDIRMHPAYQAAMQQQHAVTMQQQHAAFGYSPNPGAPSPYGYHPNHFPIGFGENMERASNLRYAESQPSRWNPNHGYMMGASNHPQFIQPQGLVTRHLLSNVEENNERNNVHELGASSNHSNESNTEGLDLELKL